LDLAVVHPRGGSSSTVSRLMLVFEERGKPENPEQNLLEQGQESTTNVTHRMAPSPGIEPQPHWCEASALTTAPSLLQNMSCRPIFTNYHF